MNQLKFKSINLNVIYFEDMKTILGFFHMKWQYIQVRTDLFKLNINTNLDQS